MQEDSAKNLRDRTEQLLKHFEPLLATLEVTALPKIPESVQQGSDSLADVLKHQQLLLENAESSGEMNVIQLPLTSAMKINISSNYLSLQMYIFCRL